jgi:CheY-like chemotaxis protein
MKKLRILIAEDDIDEIKFIKSAFEESELFEVIDVAENGEILIRNIKSGLYKDKLDVILTDLNLPLKGGFDILAELPEIPNAKDIPVFIFSNSATPMIVEKCMALGAKKYLLKPFSFLDYNIFVKEVFEYFNNKNASVNIK